MRNNKGVTIIVLVISIIVMLILAGITLSFSIGENGIIENVKNAKQLAEIEAEKEKINFAILQFNIKKKRENLRRNDRQIFKRNTYK